MVAAHTLEQLNTFLGQSREKVGLGVLGDFCLDQFIFGAVERISPEAPVPVLRQERIENRLGCAANVCLNVSALSSILNIEQHVFSVVGEDRLGEELHNSLQQLEGDLRIHLLQDPTRPTTLKTRYLAGSHHQLLRVDAESESRLSVEMEDLLLQAIEARLARLKVLIIQDYAKGLLTPRVLKRTLEMAKEAGVFVIVDPHRRTSAERYRGATLLKPNVQEAEILLGEPHSLARGIDPKRVEEGARKLKEKLDLEHVLLTRSAHGMTWLNPEGEASHFPALARGVFDVTGAGDTTVAVLASFIAAGAPVELACAMSVAASSVVVAKVGTAAATIDEIKAELARL